MNESLELDVPSEARDTSPRRGEQYHTIARLSGDNRLPIDPRMLVVLLALTGRATPDQVIAILALLLTHSILARRA